MTNSRSIVSHPSPASSLTSSSPPPLLERGRQWVQLSNAQSSDWPMMHGSPGRTGNDIAILHTSTPSHRQATYFLDDSPIHLKLYDAQIVTLDDTVFVGIPGHDSRILAFQPNARAPLWIHNQRHHAFKLFLPCADALLAIFRDYGKASKSTNLCQLDPLSGSVLSTIPIAPDGHNLRRHCALSQSTLCIATSSGLLRAIDIRSGEPQWVSPVTVAKYSPFLSQFISSSRPDDTDVAIFFLRTHSERLAAISVTTGTLLWQSQERVRIGASNVNIGRSSVAILGSDRYVRIYDAVQGNCVFEHDFRTARDNPIGSMYRDNSLYVWNNRELVAIDIGTGEVAWRWPCPSSTNQLEVHEFATLQGRLYVRSNDNAFYAIDTTTGHQEWNSVIRPLLGPSIIRANQEQIFILTSKSIDVLACSDGSALWSYQSESFYPDSFRDTDSGIYLRNIRDRLVCLDAENGQERWTANLREPICLSPSLIGTDLYTGTSSREVLRGSTKGMNPEDQVSEGEDPFGPEHWGPWLDSPATASLALSEDRTYVGTEAGSVDAFAVQISPDQGVPSEYEYIQEWTFETIGPMQTTPAINEQFVFFGCDGGMFYAVERETGTERWSVQRTAPIRSSAALSAGAVFVGGDDGVMASYDADSGSLKWSYQVAQPIRSSPAIASGMVFFGGLDWHLYALDAYTGMKLWEFATAAPIHSSPAVQDGIVYVGSDDHRVYAVAAKNGIGLWTILTKGEVRSSPAVGDGVVCIGSNDHHIYLLDTATGTILKRYDSGDPVPFSPLFSDGDFYCSILNGEVVKFTSTRRF